MGSVKNNVFVFVVCGSAEHIHTLNFSLPILRQKSGCRIMVVTDLQRNEDAIEHQDVVHIDTPKEFTNHQASIYLKTGLHKFLPKENLYCYLDSDVLAIGNNPDSIFDEFISPVRFAPDHTSVQFFSPVAMNCGCEQAFRAKIEEWSIHAKWFHDTLEEIEYEVEKSKRHVLYPIRRLLYNLPVPYYRLNKKYRLEKSTGRWLLKDDSYVLLKDRPKGPVECNHLLEGLVQEFNLPSIPYDWQHWNGGVFLFDESSGSFMDSWHNNSLSLFNKKKWNTRDQGTLIASVWQQGIQTQTLLDSRWNLIADYNSGRTSVSEDGRDLMHDGKGIDDVEFIHVYHHFGDTEWPVWNALLLKLHNNEKNEPHQNEQSGL